MKGRKPDFLIIGAMKCGTTSLHDYLGKHPEIYTTNPKEIHFFDDKNFDKGLLNHIINISLVKKEFAEHHHKVIRNAIKKIMRMFHTDYKSTYLI